MLKSLPTMLLSHLSLTHFRNFKRLEVEFPRGATILVGANAQGKTSLLEAVNYLVGATSPHTTNDRQLINFLAMQENPPFTRIVAEVQRQDRIHRIEIRIVLEAINALGEQRLRKEIIINGLKKKVGDLSGQFNAVMFLPQDMHVIEGPPETRRRYLDFTLSQADPTYARTRLDYAKVLSQRNALLKQLQDRRADGDELAFWDERISDLGASLMHARAIALHELEGIVTGIHNELTRSDERLRLEYTPSFNPADSPGSQLGLPIQDILDWRSIPREALRTGLLEALTASRRKEIRRGMTLLGPHRDDIQISVNSINLHLYGSRGQNRTAMLAIKLSEVEWLNQRTGEWPILLLDEVLAELDPHRREDLLARLSSSRQTLLTAADLMMFNEEFQKGATILHIHAGTITPSKTNHG
jgi:DNA replication and repair protein RecF